MRAVSATAQRWATGALVNRGSARDAQGRAGAADYDEGATVLTRFFQMNVGKDYKVISFQGEAERLAALINGDIQGMLVSAPRV